MPSTSGDNGRDPLGRFAVGNRLGRGNPHHRRVARLRTALLDAVTEQDIRDIVAALVGKAKQGDVVCAREVLSRCLGEPVAIDVLARLEELEALLDNETAIPAGRVGAL